MAKKVIILGVSGSIAAYKAADIISALNKSGHEIFVIMTKEACDFITPLTLQTLSSNKVYNDMFAIPEEWDTKHISLAKRADLILIAPATANIIGKLACGICDDLLTCAVTASRAPVLIAPAMNDIMYKNKIVQENIARLKGAGYKFVGPKIGRLACGDTAIGCLAEIESIIEAVAKVFAAR
ncbi:MAG: flavoprotein [Candidatus Omnitrophica bacterium]|nr:flavoprotein [Candidatus Omnitrophota bacterium]